LSKIFGKCVSQWDIQIKRRNKKKYFVCKAAARTNWAIGAVLQSTSAKRSVLRMCFDHMTCCVFVMLYRGKFGVWLHGESKRNKNCGFLKKTFFLSALKKFAKLIIISIIYKRIWNFNNKNYFKMVRNFEFKLCLFDCIEIIFLHRHIFFVLFKSKKS